MSEFTETLIVDSTLVNPDPPYYATIKAAVDALPNGGTVYVEQGTYTIASTSDTIAVPNDVAIIGRGNAVIDVTGDAEAFKNSDQDDGNTNIVISGFKLTLTRGGGSYTKDLIYMKKAAYCIIEKLTIKKISGTITAGKAAIKFENTSDDDKCSFNLISKCFIDDFGYGILLQNHVDNTVVDSNVIKSGTYNLCMFNDNNCVISNNVFSAGSSRLISLGSCEENVIQGNICNSCGGIGIELLSSAKNTILGNISSNNAGSNLYLYGNESVASEYNAINGNVFAYSTNDDGINLNYYVKRNTVCGNVCNNNGDYGIREDTTGTEKNLLGGNILYQNTDGAISMNAATGTLDVNNMKD